METGPFNRKRWADALTFADNAGIRVTVTPTERVTVRVTRANYELANQFGERLRRLGFTLIGTNTSRFNNYRDEDWVR